MRAVYFSSEVVVLFYMMRK